MLARWRWVTHEPGVAPVRCRKRRAKARGGIGPRAARALTVSGWSRCRRAHCRTSASSCEVSGWGTGISNVLRLSAVAVRRDNHVTGDAVGDFSAVFAAHEMQAQVDRGCRPGTGDDRRAFDVELIGLHRQLRPAAGEQRRVQPVGGDPAAVEQAGRGQHERAGAGAGDRGAAPRRLAAAAPRRRCTVLRLRVGLRQASPASRPAAARQRHADDLRRRGPGPGRCCRRGTRPHQRGLARLSCGVAAHGQLPQFA